MSDRKKRPQVWWCIKNGTLLLPFTARITKKQCINDWMLDHPEADQLDPWNKAVRVTVEEATP